ncbi:hypothetical protein [Natronorubrum aibiense]|uniref:Uncharacterized protein n=1 Tax=Natronorubrum aibiense TaxID=348826 RepID=A0A5P9P2R9_9EURY|nr:hypothetical protein [Natronorubrum aibiense]QFU82336.1 hypothetical protein GCU68_07260 [Natronorubrum aibiense]
MTQDHDAAGRRIMDELGEESRIPILNIEEGDVYVLLGFPIAGLLFGGLTGLDRAILPFVLLGVVLGGVLVYAAPNHLPASTWLADVYRYYCKRPRVTYSGATSESESTESSTDGGLVSYTPFKPDECTQDLTNIRRAWPGAGAIERSDGAMEAYLEIDPGNMDFAMSGDWAQIQQLGEEFANKELDFTLKFHATTRPFPVAKLIEQIDGRLTDTDVKHNPIFKALLEEYREQRPRDLEGTQQVRYFIGVEVDPFEVYDRYQDEQSPAEKLTSFPVVGFLFNPFVTRRNDMTDAEIRAAMFEKLENRCRGLQTEFIQNASGWSANRLTTVELFVLSMDFWNGEEHEYDDGADAIRDQPTISRQRRDDQ